MDSAILQAVKGYFIGAIPTIIIFLLLWMAYSALVHRPLQKILAQRYQRTQGAMARAQADIAAAAGKTADYERRLREARAAIFKAQEAQRQRMAQVHEAGLAESRKRSAELVRQARAALEQDVAKARVLLERDADQLAQQVLRSILSPARAGESA